MSSHLFPRPVASALVLAVALTLASPPAQAAGRSSLVDYLGAKVQTWLAGWLPGLRIDSVGTMEPGRAALGAHGRQAPGQESERVDSRTGRAVHRGIKPQCGSNPDPNGCPP